MVDLTGKAALVTGGGQGVGKAIALVLARQGADLAAGDVRKELLRGVAGEIRELGRRALGLEMDVTSQKSVDAAVSHIVSEWGHLDILVNNAGVVGAPGWIERDWNEEDWDFVMDVNLKGVVRCCYGVIPHMVERQYGKIINISSVAGRGGVGRRMDPSVDPRAVLYSAYSASKAGVIRHTQVLACALAVYNINVNCICPSRIVTKMGLDITKRRQRLEPALAGTDTLETRRRHVQESNLFGRQLLPEDVGKMAAFLASEDSRNITGQTIHVDGGGLML